MCPHDKHEILISKFLSFSKTNFKVSQNKILKFVKTKSNVSENVWPTRCFNRQQLMNLYVKIKK